MGMITPIVLSEFICCKWAAAAPAGGVREFKSQAHVLFIVVVVAVVIVVFENQLYKIKTLFIQPLESNGLRV